MSQAESVIHNESSYLCPICHQALRLSDSSYICDAHHTFDIAKEGYVNLLVKKSSREPGDAKLSVISRNSFLGAGYYDVLSDAVNATVLDSISKNQAATPNVLDIGCGEGYYLSRLQSALTAHGQVSATYFGLDISKPAIQLASKRHPDINFCVASALSLPFSDDTFDTVISVFAPLDVDEVSRVLAGSGTLISVVAGPRHLAGLVDLVYDQSHPHPDDKDPIKGSPKFRLTNTELVQATITIDNNQAIMDLLSMTPYYWSISLDKKQHLASLTSLVTDIDFKILTYVPVI